MTYFPKHDLHQQLSNAIGRAVSDPAVDQSTSAVALAILPTYLDVLGTCSALFDSVDARRALNSVTASRWVRVHASFNDVSIELSRCVDDFDLSRHDLAIIQFIRDVNREFDNDVYRHIRQLRGLI